MRTLFYADSRAVAGVRERPLARLSADCSVCGERTDRERCTDLLPIDAESTRGGYFSDWGDRCLSCEVKLVCRLFNLSTDPAYAGGKWDTGRIAIIGRDTVIVARLFDPPVRA